MKRAIRCGIRGQVLNQAQWPIKAPATFHTVSARVGRRCGLGDFSGIAAFALCLRHPARRRTHFLPKKQTQLRGMFLNMPHVVEQQLRNAHLGPIRATTLRNQCVRQSFKLGSARIATMLQIGLKFGFCRVYQDLLIGRPGIQSEPKVV